MAPIFTWLLSLTTTLCNISFFTKWSLIEVAFASYAVVIENDGTYYLFTYAERAGEQMVWWAFVSIVVYCVPLYMSAPNFVFR